jgi:hypothetical protein
MGNTKLVKFAKGDLRLHPWELIEITLEKRYVTSKVPFAPIHAGRGFSGTTWD